MTTGKVSLVVYKSGIIFTVGALN
jgi:hypothetical protein